MEVPENIPNAPGPDEIRAWAEAAAAGDVSAVERLLWSHHARFAGFARRKGGVDWQGKIDPEDVLQEAYIEIFGAICGFEQRDDDSFYHWATRIIDHKFIDHVRRLRRKKRDVSREIGQSLRSMSRHDALIDKFMPDAASPSHVMRRADAVTAMMTCIAQLPEHYRVVVQRVYLNEEPIAEVAAELGRSEDAVRRMLGRAVEKLREGMGRASRYLSRDG